MIIKDIEHIPFFFIIGRPRSGTTLLQSLFDAHPNVMIPFESPVIINLYNRYGRISQWNEEMIDNMLSDLYSIRKFENWPVNREMLRKNLIEAMPGLTFGKMIRIIYVSYKPFFPKAEIRLIGDKNPMYSVFTKKIFNIFPEAKYIHLVRDYRDHILSTKRVKLLLQSTTIIAYRWRKSLKDIEKLKKRQQGSFFLVKYEDFVAEPQDGMKKLSSFLGLEYFPDVFDYYKKIDQIMPGYNRDAIEMFHGNLLKPITSSAVGKWKTEMPERDVRIADYFARGYAEEFGYGRKYKTLGFGLTLYIMPRLMYLKMQGLLSIMMEFLPFRTNMHIRRKRPFLTTIYLRIFRPAKYKSLAS